MTTNRSHKRGKSVEKPAVPLQIGFPPVFRRLAVPPRPLVIFPDPRLAAVAAPVEHFDTALAALAGDLVDTMRATPGIGITAPHIGVMQRVVVLDLPNDAAPAIYVNPVLLEVSEERIRHAEGSVSMPGVNEEVERAKRVRVGY